jgi:GntR family transcriptional regulator, transcriptional repressor for pyruvate dehydrogenase complex
MAEPVFHPVSTRRTFEEAVDQIAHAIIAGDLHVGDRLPSERELSGLMRISRPTLREAVKILVDAGVLVVQAGPRGGMYVRSELVPRGVIRERSSLRISEVSGVLEARRLFEPRVAQLASLYATEDDFEAMQRTIELQREHADNRERFVQLDVRFHIAIARATRNATIVELMQMLLKRLEIALDMAIREPQEPRHALELHERTLASIKSGDPEDIELAMDEHLAFLEKVWEQENSRARLRRIPDFLLPHSERQVRLESAASNEGVPAAERTTADGS